MLEETPTNCILGSWHHTDNSLNLYTLNISLHCTEESMILHLVSACAQKDPEVFPSNIYKLKTRLNTILVRTCITLKETSIIWKAFSLQRDSFPKWNTTAILTDNNTAQLLQVILKLRKGLKSQTQEIRKRYLTQNTKCDRFLHIYIFHDCQEHSWT